MTTRFAPGAEQGPNQILLERPNHLILDTKTLGPASFWATIRVFGRNASGASLGKDTISWPSGGP